MFCKRPAQYYKEMRRGVALLLTVFLMSIFLSASLAISVVFMRAVKISSNLADSVIAFHAADSGLEQLLYLERTGQAIPGSTPATCDVDPDYEVGQACYRIQRKESTTDVLLYSFGKYRDTSRFLGASFPK